MNGFGLEREGRPKYDFNKVKRLPIFSRSVWSLTWWCLFLRKIAFGLFCIGLLIIMHGVQKPIHTHKAIMQSRLEVLLSPLGNDSVLFALYKWMNNVNSFKKKNICWWHGMQWFERLLLFNPALSNFDSKICLWS